MSSSAAGLAMAGDVFFIDCMLPEAIGGAVATATHHPRQKVLLAAIVPLLLLRSGSQKRKCKFGDASKREYRTDCDSRKTTHCSRALESLLASEGSQFSSPLYSVCNSGKEEPRVDN